MLSLGEAIDVLQAFPKAKFDETVELAFNLGVDPKKSDQMVRGTLTLPNGTGKVPRIVVVTRDEGRGKAAIEAGAMGYLTKQSAPEQLVIAIRKVISGSRYVTDEAAEALALRIARGRKGQTPLDSLSMRELQVLRRLALGNTNREIASAYNISIKTVETYRARLLKKLDLRNNAELSRFAIQNHLIET